MIKTIQKLIRVIEVLGVAGIVIGAILLAMHGWYEVMMYSVMVLMATVLLDFICIFIIFPAKKS